METETWPALFVTGLAGAAGAAPPPAVTPHVPTYAAGSGYGPSGDDCGSGD